MALLDNVMSAAAAHGGSLTRAQVRDLGCTDRDIKRWVADGQARVLWRGILAFGAAPDDDTSRHRELVTAVARAYGDRLVISHHSALVMHELPTYDADLAVVRLIRRNKGDSIATGPVRISKCRVDLVDELLNGVLVVTGAVAVAQVAEELGIDAAVVAGDAALHREVCSLQQLAAGAELIGLLRSSPRPRQAVTLMDARSESPGESLLRLIATRARITLQPQYEVLDDRGRFVARADFRLLGADTLVEFDGKVKYNGPDALFAEKRREDALRALGWRVLRFVWADLSKPAVVTARLRSALTNAAS